MKDRYGRGPDGLTDRQREVRKFITLYQLNHHGQSPTVREIAEGCRITSHSRAWAALAALRKRGVVTWTPGQHRSLVVVG